MNNYQNYRYINEMTNHLQDSPFDKAGLSFSRFSLLVTFDVSLNFYYSTLRS